MNEIMDNIGGKMKIFELLETAKETGDIITRKNCRPGCAKNMKYFEKYKSFMVVTENGDLILQGKPYWCEVTLSDALFGDDFFLLPASTNLSQEQIKIQQLELEIEKIKLVLARNRLNVECQ